MAAILQEILWSYTKGEEWWKTTWDSDSESGNTMIVCGSLSSLLLFTSSSITFADSVHIYFVPHAPLYTQHTVQLVLSRSPEDDISSGSCSHHYKQAATQQKLSRRPRGLPWPCSSIWMFCKNVRFTPGNLKILRSHPFSRYCVK